MPKAAALASVSLVPAGPGAPSPESQSETLEMLTQLGGRRTAPVDAAYLARHVLSLPAAVDWPVRRAAFEAVLRRLLSARAGEIRVRKAPVRGPWGRYVVERDGEALPYDVRLSSLEPLCARCDCADFLRASLGLCKHVLAVVDRLARKKATWQAACAVAPASPTAPRIIWDPVAASPDAPLAGIKLQVSPGNGSVPAALRRMFRAAEETDWSPVGLDQRDAKAQLKLVTALQSHLGAAAARDPAATAVLAEEASRLRRAIELAAAKPSLQRALRGLGRHLYAYQKEGVERFLAAGRLLLADDMGLGKTTQAIAAAHALFEARVLSRGLIVVPASLKAQWEREWAAVSGTPIAVVEGSAEQRATIYRRTKRGFLVTNYEQVVRDLDAISRWKPELVVLDEAQRIKNWATKTALSVKRLKPKFRLVLTGTPMENRLDELASVVEWVDDRALEPKWRLGPFHSVLADGRREVIGARNLDTLRARLAPILLRRLRSQVLGQLPPRQDTTIPIELTGEQREAHDELNRPIAELAVKTRKRPLSPAEFLRLMSLLTTQRVIANGMAQLQFPSTWPAICKRAPEPRLLETLGTPKLIELRELVSSLAVTQRRKVVVFSQWRRMLELAAWATSDLLAPAGLRALFFTGQEGERRRTQNLVEFHDDPCAAVLFLTDAGGVGLNLQKAASACINIELPWNPAVLEQRIGRIHRMGQKRPIDVYNLVSRACIEERIAGIVSDKRALFRGLFDGDSDQLRFERSGALISVLEQIVGPVQPSVEPVTDDASPEVAGNELEPAAGTASDVDDLVAAADPAPAGSPIAIVDLAAPPLLQDHPAPEVARLMQSLTMQRAADGGVRIEAPPQAAAALMSIFEGMARLLGAMTNPEPRSDVAAP